MDCAACKKIPEGKDDQEVRRFQIVAYSMLLLPKECVKAKGKEVQMVQPKYLQIDLTEKKIYAETEMNFGVIPAAAGLLPS